MTHLRHLDLGYNIIEGVQHYSGATATKATPDADEDGDAVVAPDDYTGGSGATIVPNTVVARSSTGHERSRTSEETPRKAAVFKAAAASAAAARGDAGGGRGKDEGETGCASPATADISLPSLTRLDLNNNILHNLDDLKVGGEVEFVCSESSDHKHAARFVLCVNTSSQLSSVLHQRSCVSLSKSLKHAFGKKIGV